MSTRRCPQCDGVLETYARMWVERGRKEKQRCTECEYQTIEFTEQTGESPRL